MKRTGASGSSCRHHLHFETAVRRKGKKWNEKYDASHGDVSSILRFVRGLQMCRRAEIVSTEQAIFSLADQKTSLPARQNAIIATNRHYPAFFNLSRFQ